MANRRQQSVGRRMDYGRDDLDRNTGFNRSSGVSPWQGGGPTNDIPNLLPLGGNSTEATLALANNLISNLLQTRSNNVPSLLDMPLRRDFGPDLHSYDRGYGRDKGPSRMGNQSSFRRTGTINRNSAEMRKPYRPYETPRRQQAPKKDADKSKPVSKQESNQGSKDSKDAAKAKDAANGEKKMTYDDLSPDLLKCHICNKSMWDGRSFENHLNGRAHAIMMQKTAESYALTADTMRQEFKILEMKFTRRTGKTSRDFYCAMCDMYAASGAVHRTSVGHRKLKKYLHPNCVICHKEMSTRIDLDEHRFTLDHLIKTKGAKDSAPEEQKERRQRTSRPEVVTLSTLSMEQSWVRDGRRKRRRSQVTDSKEDATDAETKVEGEKAQENPLDIELKPDNDGTIIDYKEGDDVTNVTEETLPAYCPNRGVGRSYLQPFNCIECKLCRKLLDTEETAEIHLKTWRHHQLFIKALKEMNADLKKEKEEEEEEEGDDKKDTSDNNNGNWKRRKVDSNNSDKKDELYDPEENDEECEEEQEGEHGEEQGENWEEQLDEILNDNTDYTAGDGDEANGMETEESAAVEQTEEVKEEIQVKEEVQTPEKVAEAVEEAPTPVPPVATPEPAVATPAPAVATPATPRTNPARNTAKTRGTPRGRGRGAKR